MTRTLSVFVLALVIAGFAAPQAVAQSKCSSAKWKTVGKRMSDQAKCESKALKKGVAVDPACEAKGDARYAKGFGKAEAKEDCLTLDDETHVVGHADEFLADMAVLLDPPDELCCFGTSQCVMARTAEDCTGFLGGTVGPANTVCAGATGACVPLPGAGGNCCEADQPTFSCSAGPVITTCAGNLIRDAVCVAGGVCVAR